jgi:hypothetical protein
MFYLICWLLSAVVGALIGQSKGRPTAGAFWGLLLGPLGWLVVVSVPDERAKCPECLGFVPDGARKCQHCSSPLEQVEAPIQQSRYTSMVLNRTWCDAVVVLIVGTLLGWGLWTLDEKGEEVQRTFLRIADELKRGESTSNSSHSHDEAPVNYLPRRVAQRPSESTTPVTLSQFNQLTNGMAYIDVCAILGGPGKNLTDSLFDGGIAGQIEASSYVWLNADGSNASVLFKNRQVIGKSQFGLR